MDIEQVEGLVVTGDEDNPLVALGAVVRIRGDLERAESVLVRRARNAGVTWAEIAAVLGVSKQAVHKKHGGRRLLAGEP